MVQRLGLARAILHRPDLLILDEPASGLDPSARQTLFNALRRCRDAGSTVLISSHILTELSPLCTSVGIMNKGRFREQGRTEDIVRRISPGRKIAIRVLGDATVAHRVVSGREGVTHLEAVEGELVFSFCGEDGDLAGINAALFQAGVEVVTVEHRKTDLNELYLAVAGEESQV
jgi:ABC-2 type transport system ATP-binding protein